MPQSSEKFEIFPCLSGTTYSNGFEKKHVQIRKEVTYTKVHICIPMTALDAEIQTGGRNLLFE
jgi:hypothetical protein